MPHPHPERFLNAHIYHKEEGESHKPPRKPEDLEEHLRLDIGKGYARRLKSFTQSGAP